MNDLIVFKDDEIEVEVTVTPLEDTVWLTQSQMSILFQKSKATINEHIKNIFKDKEVEKSVAIRKFGNSEFSTKPSFLYNLDVIISVGYRVKSKRGIAFRKWATRVLKGYLLEGYAINEKRLKALQKTVEIESRMLSGIIGIEESSVLKVAEEYTRSFELLDAYDHQTVSVPEGRYCQHRLNYIECITIIKNMEFSKESAIFGTEKESGKLEGILAAIFQSAFGQEAYPTLEEKAANLLYFLIKDHPFNDGCKRIAATLFLCFLDKNGILYNRHGKLISDSALVAITLMVAESKAEEKDIIVQVIINFLHW